jgi:hypothetical protein
MFPSNERGVCSEGRGAADLEEYVAPRRQGPRIELDDARVARGRAADLEDELRRRVVQIVPGELSLRWADDKKK